MNHELKSIAPESAHVNEGFGISDDAFHKMVSNLSLELFHLLLFKADQRTKGRCLLDCLNTLDPAEFGLEPKTANDYLVVGIAFAKANQLIEVMSRGVKDEVLSDVPGLMQHLLEETKQEEAIRNPVGSVN